MVYIKIETDLTPRLLVDQSTGPRHLIKYIRLETDLSP